MNVLIIPIALSLLSAVHSYVIPHAHPFGPVGPGKVFVPYPTYVGHIPFGHHPHVVHPPVFVIAHHPPHSNKPAFPGPGSDGHPGDVPFYPPQFPRFPGPFPDGEPGIVVPPPPEEPKPEGVPGGAPKPPVPECTLCGGGENGGGNGNGNGPVGPPSDEGGRGDDEPSPDGLTPKGGVPEAEPKPDEPKPEEPAPEPKPQDEPTPEEPKPEEAAPEEPKPEEPQPEQPATEEPTTQAPATEAPAAEEPKAEEEPKIEAAMPEREGPEPEDKSSEEEESSPTEAPASARLQFSKKATTFTKHGKAVAFRKSSLRRKQQGALPAALRVIPVLGFFRGLPYTQPVLASATHFEKQKGGRTSQGDGRYIFGYLVPAHGPLVPFPAGVIQKPVQAIVRLQG